MAPASADFELDVEDDDDDDYEYQEPEDGDDDDIDYEDLAMDATERTALEGENEETEQASAQETPTFLLGSDFVSGLSLSDIVQILSSAASGRGANENTTSRFLRRQSRTYAPPPIKTPFAEVKEPQANGVELLLSGEFGNVSRKNQWPYGRQTSPNLARGARNVRKSWRRLHKEDVASDVVPNSSGAAVARYSSSVYSGQYSADSSFYYTCCRDFRLHVYDTTVPIRRGISQMFDEHQTTMKLIKTVRAPPDSWTIVDSHLSPDNERMIWACVTPTVYMTSTTGSDASQTPISFADRTSQGRDGGGTWRGFGFHDYCSVWSCRFSSDGKEIVAGGDGRIFVYDLIADRRTVKIDAHENDVNSCCWADTASGNVLISASDDTFLKVWDRRSLGSNPTPSGVLVGHTEGITYVSPKGDGRYVISNGKDQLLRLWDLRKMRSNLDFEAVKDKDYGISNYDYRRQQYPTPRYLAHPQDCSVMKYHGHAVLRTLIRCHFSPSETTGQQYIYSGSADGRIHIWSLDGRVVEVLDRKKALPISYDPSERDPSTILPERCESVCVRDVSWHSQEPVIMSAGWDNFRGGSSSSIVKHEWKGLLKRGGRIQAGDLEDHVEMRERERAERSRRMPGAFHRSLMEDED